MNSLVSDVTRETLSFAYKELCKEKNKTKVRNIINHVSTIAIERLQPYLYAIMAILIIMFLMNCFQFYYYLKYLIKNVHSNKPAIYTESHFID